MSFLPEQAIKEYQKIYRKNYGELLTREEVITKAESFIGFYNQVVFGKKLKSGEVYR